MTRVRIVCLVACLFAVLAQNANAAELLMFETAGCPWCLRWHQEIGQGYPRSDEGRRAPLRVLRLGDARSAGVELKAAISFSPTFVLADGGREVGRIVGYPGADFFYGLLAGLLQKLDKAADTGLVPPAAIGQSLRHKAVSRT